MDSVSILEGYKSANELTKQLLTLATGVIALSITFTKDILKDAPQRVTLLIKLSWFAYLLSICFGMWAMMALTGMIFKVSVGGVASVLQNPYGSAVLPSFLQILTFVAGTLFIILFGVKALRKIP